MIKIRNNNKIHSSNLRIKNLKSEVNLLRSFIISIVGEDKEGKYNPLFMEEILQASDEKANDCFSDAKSFLKELRNV
ncbi:MAG: hypothetical protein V1770_02315 [bacterium]